MSFRLWILVAICSYPAYGRAAREWRRAAAEGVEVSAGAGPGMAARVLAETLSFYATPDTGAPGVPPAVAICLL